MTDEAHPLHPDVACLLEAIEFVADGESRLPQASLRMAEHALREKQEDAAFLDLLAVWHRLNEAGIQPAASQFLELVKIFPQVQGIQSAHDMAKVARQALTDGVVTSDTGAAIAKPRALGVGLRSSKLRR